MNKIIITIIFGLTLQFGYGQAELKSDFQKGVTLLKSESYKQAANAFSDVLKKATDTPLKKFCYIYRAFSYNGLGDYKNAVADLDKAIELDPTDIASYVDRGKSKAYMSDFEGAKKDFFFVLTKDSTTEQAQGSFFYLAKIEYQSGTFDKSIEYYDRFIKLDPNDPEAYFNRGAAKGMIMNPEGAIKDYDKAIELKSDYMEAYANRGVSKINLLTTKGNIHPTKEQTSDGCADLLKAKQLGDKTVEDMIFIHCNKK